MNIKEKIFDVQNFEELYRNLYIQFISMLYVLQLIKNYKVYILGDIRPLRGKMGKICDLF